MSAALRSLRRTLRVGVRQLVADPGATGVVVLGLAAAIAACVLIAQLLWNRLGADPGIPEPDRVVSLEFRGNIPGRHDDWMDGVPIAFAPALREAGAPVSDVVRLVDDQVTVRVGDRLAQLSIMFGDPGLTELFGVRALRGDLAAALARPDALALFPDAARRLFGTADPIGRRLTIRGHAMTVVALLPQPTVAAPLRTDIVAAIDSPVSGVSERMRSDWFVANGAVFARLAPGHAAEEVGAAAQALFDHGPGARSVPPAWTANGRQAAFLRAIPLSQMAWRGAGSDRFRLLAESLAASGLLVFALALVNYLNLTTVRTLQRQREIALRKCLGAGPARLIGQFMIESALVAAVGAALGIALAWLCRPVLLDLLGMAAMGELFELTPGVAATTAALVVALGALAGVYPARIALAVRCAESLAGRDSGETRAGRRLRRALTALQCTAAVALCGAGGAVTIQNHHVASLPRGFDTTGLVAVDIPRGTDQQVAWAFQRALAHQPGVDAATWSDDVPGRQEWQASTIENARARVEVRMATVDPDFFATYGVRPLAGASRYDLPPPEVQRALLAKLPASATYVDQAEALKPADLPAVVDIDAARALGFAQPAQAVGALVHGGGGFLQAGPQSYRIVAVVPHLRLEDARGAPMPEFFALSTWFCTALTLRGADAPALRRAVQSTWPKFFPDEMADVERVDVQLDARLAADRRIARFALGATTLALLLGAFGIYVLAAHAVRRSAREIVVRKLYGAGRARIALLLAREFAPLLGVAALAGLPLAAWMAQAWLAHFVERTAAAYWALPIAFAALVALTVLAAARHAVVAMNLRPTQALRN